MDVSYLNGVAPCQIWKHDGMWEWNSQVDLIAVHIVPTHRWSPGFFYGKPLPSSLACFAFGPPGQLESEGPGLDANELPVDF
jgi:hypothetical protein